MSDLIAEAIKAGDLLGATQLLHLEREGQKERIAELEQKLVWAQSAADGRAEHPWKVRCDELEAQNKQLVESVPDNIAGLPVPAVAESDHPAYTSIVPPAVASVSVSTLTSTLYSASRFAPRSAFADCLAAASASEPRSISASTVADHP